MISRNDKAFLRYLIREPARALRQKFSRAVVGKWVDEVRHEQNLREWNLRWEGKDKFCSEAKNELIVVYCSTPTGRSILAAHMVSPIRRTAAATVTV